MLPIGTLRGLMNMAYNEIGNGGHASNLAKSYHVLCEFYDKSFDNG